MKREPVRFKGVKGEAPAAKDRQHGEPSSEPIANRQSPTASEGVSVARDNEQLKKEDQAPKSLRPGERIRFDE